MLTLATKTVSMRGTMSFKGYWQNFLGLLADADLGHKDSEHEGHDELLGLLAELLRVVGSC